MNETKSGFVGFLKNKNTVTILGTLAAIGILLGGYYWQINKATTKVSVLVAKEDIQPKTEISCEMVEIVQIEQNMKDKLARQLTAGKTSEGLLTSNMPFCDTTTRTLTFPNGGYSNFNTMIPKGTPLIQGINVVDGSKIPTTVLKNIPKGNIPYAFTVNPDNTYGNAIMPDMYVDIYMKAFDAEGKVMIGRFIKDVKVLAVLDSSNRDVFGSNVEQRVTAKFIFAVDEYYHLLFRKAAYLSSIGVELIPVPITQSIDTEDYKASLKVTSKQLEEYIQSHTTEVTEDELPDNVVED